MTKIDADAIREALDDDTRSKLEELRAFAAIDSTNTFLMTQAGPAPGRFKVAVTDNQTAGRGRQGHRWVAPPGSGVCLSLSYTFAVRPGNLPALTLALGLGVIDVLDAAGFEGVKLKWPNDLIAADAKLGGILTEAQAPVGTAITVVTGLGLNVDLGEDFDLGSEASSQPVIDLYRFAGGRPGGNKFAAALIMGLCRTFRVYEAAGFARYAKRWLEVDWLVGRELTVALSAQRSLTGVAAGVADDGALLLDTGEADHLRVSSGSIVAARARGAAV